MRLESLEYKAQHQKKEVQKDSDRKKRKEEKYKPQHQRKRYRKTEKERKKDEKGGEIL